MEDKIPEGGSSKKLSLGFYINVGEVEDASTNISRATPTDGEYDPGAGYENFIDLEGGDFRIYFFSVDNKYISTFTNPVIERVDIQNSPSSKTYVARTNIEGKDMIDQITNGPTKIVMLANWRGQYPDDASLIPGVTTIDDLVVNATISYGTEPWGPVLDYEHRIPLYGVMQFPGVNLVPVMLNLTGVDLHLLRAFAKVEVIQSEESAVNIESVSLSRHNNKAYCAPLGVYHQSQYIKHTYGGDYTDSPSIPSGALTDTELKLPFYTDENGLRWGYLGYYMGRRDKWVCLDAPMNPDLNSGVVPVSPSPAQLRGSVTVPAGPPLLLAAALPAALVLLVAAALAVRRRKRKQ